MTRAHLAVIVIACGSAACGDVGEAPAAAPSPAPPAEGATLVLTNADGTEEKVPYRECSAEETKKLTALVGPVFMKAVGDQPGKVREGGFFTKIHVAVKPSGEITFGGATSTCGGEPCPRGDAKGIGDVARAAVDQVAKLDAPFESACVTGINVRMQSRLGGL